MTWPLMVESLPPWSESSVLAIFGLPPRDPNDDDDDHKDEDEDDEDQEAPVIREPNHED
jgi:hypothetical protein